MSSSVKLLVGLWGRIGAGKTTLAHSYPGANVLSFATPLKKEAVDVFDLNPQWVFGSQREKENTSLITIRHFVSEYPESSNDFKGRQPEEFLTYRQILQMIGSSRRKLNPSFWINKLMWSFVYSPYQVNIIDDLRYRNEAEAIRMRGGIIVKLRRNFTVNQESHESEADVFDDLVDFTIEDVPAEVARDRFNYLIRCVIREKEHARLPCV